MMRQGQNSKRSRGRGSGRRNVPPRHQTFDSNGPSVRIRGNAYQVHEKYLALARDAGSAGDRIAAENYLQHAEHYFRIINMDNDGDSQGRGRSQTNGGGRAERAFDGPDGQDPTIEVSGETSDGAAKTPAEPVAAKANGADAESSTSETGSGTADAAAPAPKRRISRGNGKGRRTRATPKAGDAGGDGAAAGNNGADGDTPLAEE